MGLVKQIERPKGFTIAEYLREEADADQRHEYVDGQIVAMAGGTRRASHVAVNVIVALHAALRGKPCRVYESNLRVRVGRTPSYTYPDAHVICSRIAYDPEDKSQSTILNPRLIVEVLSPSTETYDRGEKFRRYRKIDSLEEVVLVSQHRPQIETFHRNKAGEWVMGEASGNKASISLKSLKIKLKLADVYDGVDLD